MSTQTDPPTDPPDYLVAVTDPRQHAFLKAYPLYGSIVATANAIGVPVGTCYRWVSPGSTTFKGMELFSEGFKEAQKAFSDTLEALAWSRVSDPSGNRGSDVLLLALLNANHPAKWRPNVSTISDTDTAKGILAELRKASRPRRNDSVQDAVREAEDIVR